MKHRPKSKPLPRTGTACGCKPGVERDNCPQCEGSGRAIDWRAFHHPSERPEVIVNRFIPAVYPDGPGTPADAP